LEQPIANVYAEFSKASTHLLPGTVSHDPGEPAQLVNDRHATCADCHNAHTASVVVSFPEAPAIRASQAGVTGINAADGTSIVVPAGSQYENCLRCHGNSPGKQTLPTFGYAPFRAVNSPDSLNVIPQLAVTARSSHPVLHPPNSPWPQPSLLAGMLNLSATQMTSRVLGGGAMIFCSDCHNSDDNREFGGSGASGPHGSQFAHLLERRYEFSQVVPGTNFPFNGPGSPIQNLFISPSLTAGAINPGPYALCAKCHNLSSVLADVTFKPAASGRGGHFTHISELGFSCSVCHTAHGMGSLSASISGDRLVNFDLNVVATLTGHPISYNRSTNTCTLTCHGYSHYPDGSVLKLN
jgi:hypothetical protein